MNEFNKLSMKILKIAEKEMFDLNHPYVGTEHLLLSLLRLDSIKDISSNYDLTYESFKKELIRAVGKSNIKSSVVLYTPLLRKVLDNAINISKNRDVEVDEKILFSSLLTSDDGIALRILENMEIDIDNLYNDLYVIDTDTISDIGINLNKRNSSILVGRDEEINSMIEILLRKKKNNPILIGVAGVGKSSIVYELARRINVGLVPDRLKNFSIISLDMATLLSNTKYRGEFETKINNIIKEVKSKKNIILFIDEIHTIVKSGGSDGSIDAANILKPYLASDEIKVIGATTIYEYDKYISIDKALSRRFESVLVSEPKVYETINILTGVRKEYEDYYNIKISDDNIKDIVELSNKYITNRANPDKSLDVLDNVLAKVMVSNDDMISNEYLKLKDYENALKYKIKGKKRIEKKDILEVISKMTNIRILNNVDYKGLVKLIDNNTYIKDKSYFKNLIKNRFDKDHVLGMLLRGSSDGGVISLLVDNLKYNLIELDMNEYSASTSINKIIGVDPGYVGYSDECLLDKIKYHPYSLLVLRNIDSADISVINIIKSILDKGIIKNKKDEVISFNNSIIIMMSDSKRNSIGYTGKSNYSNLITPNVIDIIDNKIYEN